MKVFKKCLAVALVSSIIFTGGFFVGKQNGNESAASIEKPNGNEVISPLGDPGRGGGMK